MELAHFAIVLNVCPQMVTIPSGSFTMGGAPTEEGWSGMEVPQHRVTIPRGFAIGTYDVTFDEWTACLADGACNRYPPKDWGFGRGRRPVIGVSWNDAQAYVPWLSRKTGRHYRLPRSAAMAMVGHKTQSIQPLRVDAGALRDAATKIDLAAGTIPGTVEGKKPQKRSRKSA